MLHESDHGVAKSAELVSLAAVSPTIVCDLLPPPLAIPLGFDVAARAPVPKAAMYEDSDAIVGEYKVGPPWQTIRFRCVSDTFLTNDSPNSLLRLSSFGGDSTHPIRNLWSWLEQSGLAKHATTVCRES